MLRTNLIHAVQDYLQAAYSGPVAILREEGDAEVTPPFAIVRIGSAEDMGAGQADLWDLNIVVAVFHDADETTIEAAEAAAATVFATLHEPDPVITALAAAGIAASCFQTLTSEAGRDEFRWFHAAGFRVVASPVSE
jgi:hypothetical protein